MSLVSKSNENVRRIRAKKNRNVLRCCLKIASNGADVKRVGRSIASISVMIIIMIITMICKFLFCTKVVISESVANLSS